MTAPAVAAAPASRWLDVTGGTTVMAGGVFATGVGSRSTLPARMMRLERFTAAGVVDATKPGAIAAGVGIAGALGTDGVEAIVGAATGFGSEGVVTATGVTATGLGIEGVVTAIGGGVPGVVTGLGSEGIVGASAGGVPAATGLGNEGIVGASAGGVPAVTGLGSEGIVGASAAGVGATAGVGGTGTAGFAPTGSGGWKRRADLRRTGSGESIVLAFLEGSVLSLTGAGITLTGGSGIGGGSDAVLRVNGSTGGTSGADFLIAEPAGEPGIVMAAVLFGESGSDEVGDIIGGATVETVVVRRVTGGGAATTGRGAATDGGVAAATGIGGGLIDGARMGAEVATGSGTLEPAAAGVDSSGGVGLEMVGTGGAETSGGCGASGSGTRADFDSKEGAIGSGGTVVRAVSARLGTDFLGRSTVSFVIVGSVPVAGSAGGRLRNSTGVTSDNRSVFPLTKTFAAGFAMITRGGAGTRPDEVGTAPEVVEPVGAPGIGGMPGGVNGVVAVVEPLPGTSPVSGGALGEAKVARIGDVFEPGMAPVTGGAAGRGTAGVGSTSGSVFAREPVSDADCLICDGVGPTNPVGGRVGFCIGWVTAVVHAGGVVAPVGVGVILSDPFIGIVAAVPETGRESCVESGLSGRGGKVTRNVSRF